MLINTSSAPYFKRYSFVSHFIIPVKHQQNTVFVINNSIVASQAFLAFSNNMTFADKVLEIMSCCHDRVLTEDPPKIPSPVR